MNAMQQTDQEKWKALADAIGWKYILYEEGQIAVFTSKTTRYGLGCDLRDAILVAIERTPLEKASPKLTDELLCLLQRSSRSLDVFEIEDFEFVLKEAGVLE